MREVIDGLFAKFGTTLGTETEPREELILPEPARTLWLATHAIIERTFAQTGGCRLGGGTLLSARWKHRVSLAGQAVLIADPDPVNQRVVSIRTAGAVDLDAAADLLRVDDHAVRGRVECGAPPVRTAGVGGVDQAALEAGRR